MQVVDSAHMKALEGEAASSAIRSYFDKLCKQIAPEKMAPLLYTQGIIHRREMKDATNKYNNEEDRAQALLLVLMRSVQTRPQWFHQICEIFDEVLIESTQDIRGERYNTTQATRCFHSTHGLDIGAQVTKQLV